MTLWSFFSCHRLGIMFPFIPNEDLQQTRWTYFLMFDVYFPASVCRISISVLISNIRGVLIFYPSYFKGSSLLHTFPGRAEESLRACIALLLFRKIQGTRPKFKPVSHCGELNHCIQFLANLYIFIPVMISCWEMKMLQLVPFALAVQLLTHGWHWRWLS